MKNAGSTLAAIFEREFPGTFQDLDSDSINGSFSPAELREYLEQHAHIRALTSHQIRLPAFESDTIIPFECCFVRHPLDRLESFYTYSRAKDRSSPLGELAQKTEFPAFLRTLIERYPHFICNPQVTLIANSGRFTRPPDEEDLQRAILMLRKAALPGVVHRFDESLAAGEYFLKPAFPELHLHYRIENATRPLPRTLADRERQIRQTLGEDLFRDVRRLNELDYQLCRAVEREVERRLSLVPALEARLQEFTSRCGCAPALSPAVA